ncbi:hypothetical protein ACFQHN_17780 [Natrialbaceae archaeon GCM10025896]
MSRTFSPNENRSDALEFVGSDPDLCHPAELQNVIGHPRGRRHAREEKRPNGCSSGRTRRRIRT